MQFKNINSANLEMYKEVILDLYKNPLNKKVVQPCDTQHKEYNPLCGDEIELFIKFDNTNCVEDIGFIGDGCAISQAAISLLTEEIKKKHINEIKKITSEDATELLGIDVTYTRIKCALLGYKALQGALAKYQK